MSSSEKISFLEYQIPPLLSDDYSIKITQHIQGDSFQLEGQFSINGPRFSMADNDVKAVYPIANSTGNHSNVIPHLILNRDSLPWERKAQNNQAEGKYPWLALLVFCGDEIPIVKNITLGELGLGIDQYETSQKADDKLSVIDIPISLLEELLPKTHELKTLAHVRQVTGSSSLSVLLANRLPLSNQNSTVHLISLENCVDQSDQYNWPFTIKDEQGELRFIRLVSLHQWSFKVINEQFNFSTVCQTLDYQLFRLFKTVTDTRAQQLLNTGFVPLAHQLRQGQRLVSWYRGPFMAILASSEEELTLPAVASDQLLRFRKDLGMFDVSYASAWQLGRLLALADQDFALKLARWKEAYVKQFLDDPDFAHLPKLNDSPEPVAALPQELEDWLLDLRHLKPVPFNYLVPAAELLPPNSLRFFTIDTYWLDCLEDGAFSIGNIYTNEQEEAKIPQRIPQDPTLLSGLILRSEILVNWPGLIIEAFNKNQTQLKQIRKEQLADDILICLFEGDIQADMTSAIIHFVDFTHKPEMLHFGFDQELESEASQYTKRFRNSSGILTQTITNITNEFFHNEEKRIVDISFLKDKIASDQQLGFPQGNDFTSEEFALSLIEGVEKVRFTIK